MVKSSLATKTVLADSSNYNQGRFGYKVCKITPHHMAGILTGEQCAKLFQNPNRNASANYCIGNSGDIVCSLGEENRAWTSSSKKNDCQAITIEVSNCERGGQWKISDAAWNALVNLCVDICKRYNFKLTYDGTPNGSLTRHNMFANTNCPGPYLQGRFQELADTVNARLEGGEKPATNNSGTTTKLKFKKNDKVVLNGHLYRDSQGNGRGMYMTNHNGTITKTANGSKPYHIDKLGWVAESDIKLQTTSTSTTAKITYKTVTNCSSLNLRTSAKYGNNVYKAVKKGTKLEYLGMSNGWAKVKYNGKTLYCGKSYLK